MTSIYSLEQWFEIVERGTSGDQVMDILYSWKSNLAQRINELTYANTVTMEMKHRAEKAESDLARLTRELEDERRKNSGVETKGSLGWTCSRCGRVHAIWVATCPCWKPRVITTDTSGKWTSDDPQLPKDGE